MWSDKEMKLEYITSRRKEARDKEKRREKL